MKLVLSTTLCGAFLLAAACSTSAPAEDSTTSDLAGVSPGKLRGTDAVSKTIASRLFADPMSTDTTHAIFSVKNVAGKTMAGATGSLAEGTPTPISTTLWYAYASHIGDALATACTSGAAGVSPAEARFVKYQSAMAAVPPSPSSGGPPAVAAPVVAWALRPNVAAAIRDVCTYSGDHAQSAGAYFDAVMGPGSSMAAERTAFIGAFSSDASAPEERVRDMTIALMTNPYFVLER